MRNHNPQHDLSESVQVPRRLVDRVRVFIQDYPEVNELIEGVETTDEKIAEMLSHTLDKWNFTPPVMAQYEITFPRLMQDRSMRAARAWIVEGTAAEVMELVVRKLARNDMPFTGGNVSIQAEAVWRNLQPMVQDLRIRFKEAMTDIKRAWNIEQIWSSAYTDLLYASRGQDDNYITIYV